MKRRWIIGNKQKENKKIEYPVKQSMDEQRKKIGKKSISKLCDSIKLKEDLQSKS